MARAPILVLLFVVQVLARDTTSEKVCEEPYRTAINVTTSFFFSNGTIRTSEGDWFHPGTYVNAANGTFQGCVCKIKRCVRKCCLQGMMLSNGSCVEENNGAVPLSIPKEVGPPLERFHVVYGKRCSTPNSSKFPIDPKQSGDLGKYYLSEDGVMSLKSPQRFQFYDYCLDHIDDTDVTKALVCLGEEQEVSTSTWLYITGMLVSAPFLLATFIVYAILPTRNLYSKCLMCYVISLFTAYLLLSGIQLVEFQDDSDNVCLFLATFCYFCFMVSFFTMNIMAFDIWLTFSGIRSSSHNRKRDETRRFIFYNLYMWGVPALLVALILTLNETADATAWYHPHMGEGRCWFGNDFPVMIYFYSIIAIIICVDILLFATTAWRIKKIQEDTKMLKTSDDSRKHHEKDKQRFNLYLKLMLAMGINWSTEIISWAISWQVYNVPQEIWYLTDLCNALYGVFIFFMFVFKKKILTQLRERIGSTIKKSKSHLGIPETTTEQHTPRETTPNPPSDSRSTSVTRL